MADDRKLNQSGGQQGAQQAPGHQGDDRESRQGKQGYQQGGQQTPNRQGVEGGSRQGQKHGGDQQDDMDRDR